MVVFKYRKESGSAGAEVFRPVADVKFRQSTGKWIECHPYIDSGADVTLLPLSFGKLLGLKIESDKIVELYGIGKQGIPVLFKKVEVRIGNYKFAAEIAWALIEEIVPLLGRKDIFDKFHVHFKQDRGIIEFVRV